MEMLEGTIRLPSFGEVEEDGLLDALAKSFRAVEDEVWGEAAKRINFLLDRTGTSRQWIYFKKGTTEVRIGINDAATHLVIQYLSGTTWTDTGWKLQVA